MNYSEVLNARMKKLNRAEYAATLKHEIEALNQSVNKSDLGLFFSVSIPDNKNLLLVEWDRKNTRGEWEAEEQGLTKYTKEFEFDEWKDLETFFAQIVSTCNFVFVS